MRQRDVTRLHSDHLQPSTARLGAQDGRLVPCAAKPALHGWHPANEDCGYCPPLTGHGEAYYAYVWGLKALDVSTYGVAPPWATLSRAERKEWHEAADNALRYHQRAYPGDYPVWYP